MIDVGNYGKVSNMLSVRHRRIGRLKRARVYTGAADSPTRRVIAKRADDDTFAKHCDMLHQSTRDGRSSAATQYLNQYLNQDPIQDANTRPNPGP